MAAADYRLCDCCDGKVFYDSNLNYEFGEVLPSGHMKVDYLGDWAVICEDCAKTHKTMVLTNEQAAALATPPVASGALTEEQIVCALGCIANGRGAGYISTANAIAVREFIRAAAAAPNAALVAALEALIEVAEECYSWESFPGNAIAQARAALAQARAALAQAGAA